MGTAKDNRDARTRKRQQDRRRAAQQARKERNRRAVPAAQASVAEAARWPIAEAWVSQDWDAPAGALHGALVRVRGTGAGARAAVLLVEADPVTEGLVSVSVRTDLKPDSANGAIAALVGSRTLLEAAPESVARLVHDALDHRRHVGLPDPRGVGDAVAFLGAVDPDEADETFRFGEDTSDDPTEEVPRRSWWARLLGR
jgi:hypothetical protein